MECKALNQTLSIYDEAKMEFKKLCQSVNQEIIHLDKNDLLLPGNIIAGRRIMTFGFASEFRRKLWEKFTSEAKTGYMGFNNMNRDELEDYVVDKKLDIDVKDYRNQPLEEFIDAVREEVGFANYDYPDDREADELEIRFEHIGICAWKPIDSDNAMLSVYVEMESDETNWPLIKRVARKENGEILLNSNDWDFNSAKCKSFDLSGELNPNEIALEIVKVAEVILTMVKEEEK